MKKIIFVNITILTILFSALYLFIVHPHQAEHEITFKISEKNEIMISNDHNKWNTFNMIGVNMGTGYPDTFPNEFNIKKEVYLNWLEKIADMNANTIRVYKIQSPEFYKALSEYNNTHKKKLYLLQGINFDENLMNTDNNILDNNFLKDVIYKESDKTIKAVHGDLVYFDTKRNYLSTYSVDVSEYLVGYTLGVEWDKVFVDFNNIYNDGISPFKGDYLYCSYNARPFENFLAKWGDYVLGYEIEEYNKQPLISFCNWTETDSLINEVVLMKDNQKINKYKKAKEITINTNVINLTQKVKSGMFASYNVYPYFPMFLQYGDYTKYKDETGKSNPYYKYLSELVKFHDCPVVITEYGIPSSRNRAYGDIIRGFSHGGLNEKEQGEAIKTLFYDIKKAGCKGSFLFTWQDEWYKRAWNELVISDLNGRNKWSNTQCVEQAFGILSFDPGKADKKCYPDGNYSEWTENDIIYKNKNQSISMKSDERFLYFYIKGSDIRNGKNKLNLAIDTHPKIGKKQQGVHKFKNPVDFIIQISDNKSANLYVNKDYDINIYSMFDKLNSNSSLIKIFTERQKYSNISKDKNLDSNFKLVTRAGGDIESYKKSRYALIDAGKLVHGNGNPESKHFDSNADYYINGDKIEIRIPWQLLNFRNPAEAEIIDDLRSNNYEIVGKRIKDIKVAMYYDDTKEVNNFAKYKLKTWHKPEFHERLKESYYIMKEVFRRESNDN